MRELIPSRSLRTGMKNMKMGALQHAKGSRSQAKVAPGWAGLGEDLQTGLLECPCGRGSKPRHQDAVHLIGECAFSKPVREKVVEDMSRVIAAEGQAVDWYTSTSRDEKWPWKSGKSSFFYSLIFQSPLSLIK